MVRKNKIRETKSRIVFQIFNYTLLFAIMFVCVYPILYVLFASFSEPQRLIPHRGLLFAPLGFTVKGYELVLQNKDVYTGYLNTVIYVVSGTFISVLMTLIGGYCLSRKNLLWKNTVMMMITFTMFFSGGMIPTFLLIQNLGMVDTRWAMIIPTAISTYNLIIMRTAISSIPYSLEEAARIDGASSITILFKIIMPLAKPTIAVMTLFYAFAKWNSWFEPMLYLRDRKLFPLQTILRELLITNDMRQVSDPEMLRDVSTTDLNKELVQYATVIVATVPMLMIYPFLQKYFTKGVMIGAVKG